MGAHQPAATPEKVLVRHIRMRLRTPFVTALGVEHERDILIIEVHGGGHVGYGEAPVMSRPAYNEETVVTAWHVLNDFFVPALFRAAIGHPREVAAVLAIFRGHSIAKAGLEGAVWDWWARVHGLSLSAALGGTRTKVEAGISLGWASDTEELLRWVEEAVEGGYRRVKLKIAPGRDVDVAEAVRAAFPGVELAVDANGSYRPADAAALQRLDDLGLSYIEQPLPWDDLLEHARLQARLRTPICLDESVCTAEQARQALELGSCRMFNVKSARLGGHTAALAVHALAGRAVVPVWCGGMLETGIGRAHNVALASLPGFSLPGDLSASDRYWLRDIVDPPFELDADGFIAVPSGPGLGVAVDVERLAALTVRTQEHVFRAGFA